MNINPRLPTIPEEEISHQNGPFSVTKSETSEATYLLRTKRRGAPDQIEPFTVRHLAVRECDRRMEDWIVGGGPFTAGPEYHQVASWLKFHGPMEAGTAFSDSES